MESGIILNGEEMTWKEYERREQEKRDAIFAEQAKHFKSVSELKNGDKIRFEWGDFGIYVALKVDSVKDFEVTGEVIESDRTDYKIGEVASINFGYDKQFKLMEDQ